MDSRTLGLLLVALGLGVALVGLLVMAGLLGWFGRLPGDIRIEGENVRVFVPIVSMLLISLVLTLVFNFVRRLL
jgi:hypothetical protein